MKLSITFVFCTFLLSQLATAQDSPAVKSAIYRVKVKTSSIRISAGYLYALTDSMLLLSKEKNELKFYAGTNHTARIFDYKDLDRVSIYNRGKIWKSTLSGLVTGALVGAVIGFASGDDPKGQWFAMTAGEKAAGLGIFGGAVGGVTGLIIGLAGHKTFIIHGKKEKYEKMRNKMMTKLSL